MTFDNTSYSTGTNAPATQFNQPNYIRTSDGYYRYIYMSGGEGYMAISKNGRNWTGGIDCGTAFSNQSPAIDCGSDDVIWALHPENASQNIYKGTPNKSTVPYTYTFETIQLSASPEYYGAVAVCPMDPNNIILAFRRNNYISRDGGATWTPINIGTGARLQLMVWVNTNRIIVSSYNYNEHFIEIYSLDYTDSWALTDIATALDINYCAHSDIDIDDDGNVYLMFSNAGVITVRKFPHDNYALYADTTFTSIANTYNFNGGSLLQRKSGEFLIATNSSDGNQHVYYSANGLASVKDLGITLPTSSVHNFSHHRIDDEIIPLLVYYSGAKSYVWYYDDTIKVYDNLVESVEFVEKDLMKSGAISFDGLDEQGNQVSRYIRTQSLINSLTTNFTFEYWIYFIEGYRWEPEKPLLSRNSTGGSIYNVNGAYQYVGTYNGLTLTTGFNLTGSKVERTANLPYNISNSWHHIAISYDGSTLLYYLDGVQIYSASAIGTLQSGSSYTHFGYFTTYWTIGKMAEIRVWNITRTADEISNNMKKRLDGNETGLILYYPLNDGSGTIANDVASGNDGVIYNSTWTDTCPPIPNVKFTDDYKIIASEFIESDTETSPFRLFPDKIQSRKFKEYYQTDVITDGLVLWLDAEDFTNTPQTTTWRDRSGVGNHATVNNFAYTTASGDNGKGRVTFDGTNDYLEVANSSSLNPTAITIEVRFKYKTRSVWNFFACKRTLGTNGYLLYTEQTSGEVSNDWGGNGDRWNTGYIAPLNTELTLTITCTAGKRILYVNGQYQTETTAANTSLVSNTSPLRISKNTIAENDWVAMDFKYMRIYNRVLSADEVLSNYNAGLKS